MDFLGVMQNMAIGIAGGIFSSIIVSVVFYILNEFQNELNMAKDMVYPLYGLIALNKTINVPSSKEFNRLDVAKKYYDEAANKFDRYEPWRFKYELNGAIIDTYEILTDGKYASKEWDYETLSQVSDKAEKCMNEIEMCEKDFGKQLIKRIFMNKIIIIMLLIFSAVIIIA